MKRSFTFIALALLALFFTSFNMQKKKTVVFFGDSITELGVKPGGYVSLVKAALEKQGRSGQFNIIGAGIGGNKVYDLYLRMEEDVLSHKPDLVFVYVGINDVWHKRSHGTGTDADKFEKFYNRLIDKLQAAGARVVVCTPSVIGEKKGFENEMDGDLNRYAAIIRGIAKNKVVELVDLRKAFGAFIEAHNPDNKASGILTNDQVHLNDAGNRLVAEEVLKLIR